MTDTVKGTFIHLFINPRPPNLVTILPVTVPAPERGVLLGKSFNASAQDSLAFKMGNDCIHLPTLHGGGADEESAHVKH